MVVNNAILLLVATVFVSTVAAAKQEVSQAEILNNLRIKVEALTKLYEDRVDFCEQQAQRTPLPVLDMGYMLSIDVTKEQIITGLGYLYGRNETKCEGDLKIKLAYAIGSFSSMKQDYNLDTSLTGDDISVEVLYISYKAIEFEIKYYRLPEKLRIYLEKLIGDKPFEVIKAVEKNNLSPEYRTD